MSHEGWEGTRSAVHNSCVLHSTHVLVQPESRRQTFDRCGDEPLQELPTSIPQMIRGVARGGGMVAEACRHRNRALVAGMVAWSGCITHQIIARVKPNTGMPTRATSTQNKRPSQVCGT